jgi:vacuolar-type H+-ATPase subunit E/Vma4
LREAARKRRAPVTERARDHLAIKAANLERQSLITKARDYVREHVSAGVDAFKKRYEAVTKGVEAFRERANQYLEKQAEQTKQRDIAMQLQTRGRSGPGLSR